MSLNPTVERRARFGRGSKNPVADSDKMALLEDLARRGSILVLAELARRQPLTMGEFTAASGLAADGAKRLRDELVSLKLIEWHVAFKQGALEIHEITLTAVGKQVGGFLKAADDVLRSHHDPQAPRRSHKRRLPPRSSEVM